MLVNVVGSSQLFCKDNDEDVVTGAVRAWSTQRRVDVQTMSLVFTEPSHVTKETGASIT